MSRIKHFLSILHGLLIIAGFLIPNGDLKPAQLNEQSHSNSSVLSILNRSITSLSIPIGNLTCPQVFEQSHLTAHKGEPLAPHDFKSLNHLTRKLRRPLSNKQDTILIATLDGTLHLVDINYRKVLWSFNLGPSIYSSYQAPVSLEIVKDSASGQSDSFYLDCGDDWELYINYRHLGIKEKLEKPIEDIIKDTPHIFEDRGVILGSKKTAVFSVDPRTGRLISNSSVDSPHGLCNKDDIEALVESGKTTLQFPLLITRTDYSLQAFAPNTDKVLWSLAISDIGASLPCDDILSSINENGFVSSYELGSKINKGYNMPLSCQPVIPVYRFRGHNMLDFFANPDKLIKASDEEIILPVPAQNYLLMSKPMIHKLFHTQNDMFPMPTNGLVLPSQPKYDRFLDSEKGLMVVASSQELALPPQLNPDKCLDFYPNNDYVVFSSESQKSKNYLVPEGFLVLAFSFVIVIFVGCWNILVVRRRAIFNQQPGSLNGKHIYSKRKRSRKIRKTSSKEQNMSPKKESGAVHMESDNNAWLKHNTHNDVVDGCQIGKLVVSNIEIAKGSNGTIVLQGMYDGRRVAVKRLVQAHHDVAIKEIENLIASDQHPNIVRWFGVEYDQNFVYLALERCTCSLYDLIQACSDSSQNAVFYEDLCTKAMLEYKGQLNLVKNIMQDIRLWEINGFPSTLLLRLMRDVVSGVVHLHELGIVHRDLKPQNVLISKERYICAKLSDMGISKRLPKDMSSFGQYTTGHGSSGWQAPEQLLNGRQTRAIDMFSLGCVLFFCITGGRHPFGVRFERDSNIVKNKLDLFLVEHIPEAVDMFSRLLDPDSELRPKAVEVLQHPLFWNSEVRLCFLRDTSDRVELEDRVLTSDLLKSLESVSSVALGVKWNEKMEPAFISNIGSYRRYKYDSVRDLLRVIRNKLNHYRELPQNIQEILGSVPEGFEGYFTSRFPSLLIEVYKVMYRYCNHEKCFRNYFGSNII